ncbi:hypothetical protein PQR34_45420 [Paraburkholderia sediminicola]|uniref:hypothetical protein n=1 Tax=Paraburkholderia sediminicola TaxID=458836 RepID=UPI0038B9E09B
MKDTYRSTAHALGDALRHVIEQGGKCSLGVLHQRVTPADVLTGFDGTTQSAHIRSRLDRLPAIARALLVVSYAPRVIVCNCGAACCARHRPNPEYAAALTVLLAHIEPLLTGRVLNVPLRSALVENVLRHTRETNLSIAQRCGTHRSTVADHLTVIEAALVGTRERTGEFDGAFLRIDTLLREAGIVGDATEAQAVQASGLTAGEHQHERCAAVAC